MRRTGIVAAALVCGTVASPGVIGAAPSGEPIAVSYADLPPALNLVPYATVEVPVDTEFEVGTIVPQAAVLADGG